MVEVVVIGDFKHRKIGSTIELPRNQARAAVALGKVRYSDPTQTGYKTKDLQANAPSGYQTKILSAGVDQPPPKKRGRPRKTDLSESNFFGKRVNGELPDDDDQ